MSLQRFGFFRELPHGNAGGPLIAVDRGNNTPSERCRIVEYLCGGVTLAATGTLVGDWFKKELEPFIELALRTDGIWVWPSDSAYYVEKHGVLVPVEFVDHMKRNGWEAPKIGERELLEIESRFFDEAPVL